LPILHILISGLPGGDGEKRKQNPKDVSDRNTSQGSGRSKPSRSWKTTKADDVGVEAHGEAQLEKPIPGIPLALWINRDASRE
jgi:hypothetical protein